MSSSGTMVCVIALTVPACVWRVESPTYRGPGDSISAGDDGPLDGTPVICDRIAGGSGVGVTFDPTSGAVTLDPAQTVGTFTTTACAAPDVSSWTTIEWETGAPCLKPMPDAGLTEVAYSAGNTSMAGNVLLLHLDDVAGPNGTVVTDSSGAGNDAIALGGVGSDIGRVGNAASFDGVDDWIDTGIDFPPGPFTAVAWAWRDPTDIDRTYTGVVSKWSIGVGPEDEWFMGHHNGGVSFWFMTTTGAFVRDTSVPFTRGAWLHIALTYDGTNLTGYVDGQPLFDDVVPNPGNDGTLTVKVGTNDGGSPRNFLGLIDEVAVFDRALNATEVLNIYRRGAARVTLMVRICDDPNCGGSLYFGPDGTAGSNFSEVTNASILLPSVNLPFVRTGRYVQTIIRFSSEDAGYRPSLRNITLRGAISR